MNHPNLQSPPMALSNHTQQLTAADVVQQDHYQHQQQQQQLPIMQQEQEQQMLPQQRKGSSGSSHRNCKTEGHNVSATVCSNCGTTTTPLWRRAPTGETICNACGLYYKARNTVRPPWLKRNAIKKAPPATPETTDNNGTCPGDGHCDGTGGSLSCDGCPAYNQHQVNRQALVCANCGTNTTPLWRRDEAGNTICNACGLYFKLHNIHRPATMKRSVIKRRKRVALAASPPPAHHHRHHPGNNENHDHHNRKHRVQRPPTPASTSGSERGYFTSDEEDCSNAGQKRKAPASRPSNKRQCSRQVPPIEDYIAPKSGTTWKEGTDDCRSLNSAPSMPQVQIHNNSGAGRLMGTPSIPLPPVYPTNNGFQSGQFNDEPSGSNQPSTQSNSISALLNPTSPTTAPPQLPPISTIPPPVGLAAASSSMVNNMGSRPQVAPGSIAPLSVDANFTQQILHHRQELQREVSHLSMLLNRTTAILVGLDQAYAESCSNNNTSGNPPPSSIASLLTNGPLQQGMPVSATPMQQSSYVTLPPPTGLSGPRSLPVTSDRG